MHTLGCRNRSENEMTSVHFQCFDDDNIWDLVTGKLKQLGGKVLQWPVGDTVGYV